MADEETDKAKGRNIQDESSSEQESPTPPTIMVSPWRNRREFERQVEEATLRGLETMRQGVLFRWDSVSVFGDKVVITFENLPTDEQIGPHAVIHLSHGTETLGVELNTSGVRMYSDSKPRGGNQILDVGDNYQIPDFIGVCARALELGIPPDGIMDAAIASHPRRTDYVVERRQYFEQNRRDFSRQLSERLFF